MTRLDIQHYTCIYIAVVLFCGSYGAPKHQASRPLSCTVSNGIATVNEEGELEYSESAQYLLESEPPSRKQTCTLIFNSFSGKNLPSSSKRSSPAQRPPSSTKAGLQTSPAKGRPSSKKGGKLTSPVKMKPSSNRVHMYKGHHPPPNLAYRLHLQKGDLPPRKVAN